MALDILPRGRRAWLRASATWAAVGLAAGGAAFLMIRMPGRSHRGPLPPLTADEAAVEERLRAHVRRLSLEIGERNLRWPRRLDEAARTVAEELESLGYPVSTQPFEVEGETVRNVEGEMRGTSSPGEIVLVGSHYDSVFGSPGANDNATGVAATLEVARLLRGRPLPKTVRFVAFVNEEPPFFQTDDMGSRVYARRSRARGEVIVAMFSLETLGCYSDAHGSQEYPFPFGAVYPDTADFVGFVADRSSAALVRRAIGSFRRHTAFPSEGLAAPGFVTGVSWSDHWAFAEEGYPAIMVTDTAFFRDSRYHTAEDTWERIDYARLARVTAGLARVVAELAQ